MKNRITFFLVTICLLFFVNTLFANSFQRDRNVNITSEVNDDLYVAGGNIIIDAPVRGDLVGVGGDIIIQDTITEDVLLIGGTLKISGYIGDDLRVGGGTVMILNRIDGDLLIGGGEVTVGENAIINGDIQLAGGKLIMNGTVYGIARVRGGEVIWNGVAKQNLMVKSGALTFNGRVEGETTFGSQNIELGENAQFFNKVEYWNGIGELDFGNTLLNGAIASFNQDLQVYESDLNWRYLGLGLIGFWIYRLVTAALIIALLIWMFHRFFTRNEAETNRNYLSHLGVGVLYVIGLPLLILLAFITVVGIPIGFFLITFFGLTIALGHILASLLIAYGLNHYYKKEWNRQSIFKAAVTSFLVIKIVAAIPFLGFLLSILLVMMAFGTILYAWWNDRKARRFLIVE